MECPFCCFFKFVKLLIRVTTFAVVIYLVFVLPRLREAPRDLPRSVPSLASPTLVTLLRGEVAKRRHLKVPSTNWRPLESKEKTYYSYYYKFFYFYQGR